MRGKGKECSVAGRTYILRHRKCGERGYIHSRVVCVKTRTSEVRASEGFSHNQRVNITPYKAISMT